MELTKDIKEFIFIALNLLLTVESKLGVVIPGIISHSPYKYVLETPSGKSTCKSYLYLPTGMFTICCGIDIIPDIGFVKVIVLFSVDNKRTTGLARL